jgi:flotillin
MAYDLQRHRQNQELKKEEYKVKLVEKEQSTILGEKEIKRMEKELEANVKRPAEARQYEAKLQAEADAYRLKQEAEANAEAERIVGEVRSKLILQEGTAEADAMRKKAESWQKYTQAAMFEMIMAKLPSLAEAIAGPLSKVDKITVVNTGGEDGSTGLPKITGDVAKILAQMPEVIDALTGVDVKQLMANLPQSGGKVKGEKTAKKKGPEGKAESKSKRRT